MKKLPVRVIKKGKTRGRPSKCEKNVSKVLSWYLERPDVKKAIEKMYKDMIFYAKEAG